MIFFTKLSKQIVFLFVIILFASCDNISGVDKEENTLDSEVFDRTQEDDQMESAEELVKTPQNNLDSVTLGNGIKITWKGKGQGKKIKKNDLIRISYKNTLPDGTIYDGNHLIKKSAIPFFVGWNQQTKGWDIAFQQLNEGDDVEIFLPANLARGEKGIPGLVPPNSPNILFVKVHEIIKPDEVVDDIRIWRVEERKDTTLSFIEFEDKVALHYWVSTKNYPRFDNSYQRGEPFSLVMGDGNIVPGLYKALHFAKEGDKLMIHIPSKEAYGTKGLVDYVQPNEDLFYDIMVMNVQKSNQ